MAGSSNSPEQPSSLEMSLLWQQMELNNKYQSEPSTEGDAQAGARLLRQACDTFLRSYLTGCPKPRTLGLVKDHSCRFQTESQAPAH